jgi:hypothetical protein
MDAAGRCALSLRSRLAVLAAAVALGCVAWLFFRDAGITVSIAIAAVYILLLSINVPLDDWARVENLRSVLGGKNAAISLLDPCPADSESHRHVHFAEVLENVPAEKMCRAHGALKLTEKLIRDVRHDWERGVFWAFMLFLIWGVLSFGKPNGGSSTSGVTTAPPVDRNGLTSLPADGRRVDVVEEMVNFESDADRHWLRVAPNNVIDLHLPRELLTVFNPRGAFLKLNGTWQTIDSKRLLVVDTLAPAQKPVAAADFDLWKGVVTALIGFYKLASSVDFLHWFRKQNSSV